MLIQDVTEPKSASQTAYDYLREAILTGKIQPGTMLGELPLAKEIGLSRTPVRTALALLQDEGWVVLYPKRGALVQGLEQSMIADMVEARFILESSSVDRSNHQQRVRLADRLRQSINSQHISLAESDLRAFIEATIAFHRSFVEIGGNAVMLELYDRLADRQRFLLFRLGSRLLDRREAIIAEHRELVNALQNEDPSAFSDLLRKHLTETSGHPV